MKKAAAMQPPLNTIDLVIPGLSQVFKVGLILPAIPMQPDASDAPIHAIAVTR
jgi:hypothetical protein